jgi:hypothetical protein
MLAKAWYINGRFDAITFNNYVANTFTSTSWIIIGVNIPLVVIVFLIVET